MEKVGDGVEANNASWSFGGDTSLRFDEHVEKSVPLYHQGHTLIAALSDFFLTDGSTCYDLGCATGKLTQMLVERHSTKRIQIVAVDAERDMVQRATTRCQNYPNLKVRHEDLLDLEFEKADLIVCYYTMQFVKPKHRQMIFDRIYQALHWGGGFLLFEKVRGPDARFQDIMTTVYNDYKLEQGYTGDEILAKSRSLKGILEPFSTAGNLGLLQRAGFVDITTVMKYVCFEGFLAIK
ncbi:MAG: methyltransferase domain-containing protein [Gemmataceae bacterium]